MNWTIIILAIAPALAICGYIIHKDRFDKESIKIFIAAFLFGIISVFPAMIVSLGAGFIVKNGNFINTALFSFLVVAISEEFGKFFFLRYILFKRKSFSEPQDAIIYAVIIGLGFATFENLLISAQIGINAINLNMLTTIPAHLIFAIVMAYHIGLAKFDLTHKDELLRKGLVYPVLLHGLYTFFILQNFMPALIVLFILGLWMAVKYIRYILTQPKNDLPFQ